MPKNSSIHDDKNSVTNLVLSQSDITSIKKDELINSINYHTYRIQNAEDAGGREARSALPLLIEIYHQRKNVFWTKFAVTISLLALLISVIGLIK